MDSGESKIYSFFLACGKLNGCGLRNLRCSGIVSDRIAGIGGIVRSIDRACYVYAIGARSFRAKSAVTGPKWNDHNVICTRSEAEGPEFSVFISCQRWLPFFLLYWLSVLT